MANKIQIAVATLLASFAISFALANASEKPIPAQLALNWKAEPEFGGFYEAARKTEGKDRDGTKTLSSINDRHGIDVKIVPGGAGQPVPQMVAAGKVEFGIANADEVLIARARGADLVALFAVYQTYPQGIMVHESSGFKSLADFFASDSTLAIEKGAPYATYLFKKFGKGKLKVVPYSGGVAGFLHDPKFAQQCFVTSEPIAAKREKSDPKTFLIADAGFNPYTTVLITSGKYLREHKQAVQLMVEATRKGWEQYLESPAEANKLMQKLNSSMDLATFDNIAEVQKPLIATADTKARGLGSMQSKRWKELAGQLVELKVIDKAPDADKAFAEIK